MSERTETPPGMRPPVRGRAEGCGWRKTKDHRGGREGRRDGGDSAAEQRAERRGRQHRGRILLPHRPAPPRVPPPPLVPPAPRDPPAAPRGPRGRSAPLRRFARMCRARPPPARPFGAGNDEGPHRGAARRECGAGDSGRSRMGRGAEGGCSPSRSPPPPAVSAAPRGYSGGAGSGRVSPRPPRPFCVSVLLAPLMSRCSPAAWSCACPRAGVCVPAGKWLFGNGRPDACGCPPGGARARVRPERRWQCVGRWSISRLLYALDMRRRKDSKSELRQGAISPLCCGRSPLRGSTACPQGRCGAAYGGAVRCGAAAVRPAAPFGDSAAAVHV